MTSYLIFHISQKSFRDFMNRPIREEGGKIQTSKLVQLWTKFVPNLDQNFGHKHQKCHSYDQEIVW